MKFFSKTEFSIFILAFLPIFFFLSSNAYHYDYQNTIIALLAVTLLNVLIIAIFKKAFKYKRKIYETIFLTVGFIEAVYYFYNIQNSLINSIYVYIIIAIALFGAIIALYKTNNLKKMNIIIFILFLIYFVKFDIALFKDVVIYPNYNKKFSTNEEFENLKFNKKPNIYYFHLESYAGNEALKKFYNFDNSEFHSYLNKNNFKIYNNNFSNYNATFSTLLALFTMNHHYYNVEYGNLDLARASENIISGNKYNSVLITLKNNGYKTNYYTTSIDTPKKYNIDSSNREYSIAKFTENLFKPKSASAIKKQKWKLTDDKYYSDLTDFIEKANKETQPNFFFIELHDVFHTSPNYVYQDFKKEYIAHLNIQNQKTQIVLNNILKDDKDAIIIMSGDHGAYAYREQRYKKPKAKINIQSQDKTLDCYNTSLFVRYPFSKNSDPNNLTHVNIFRYIFYELSDKKEYAKNKKEDITITKGKVKKIIVKDGKILTKAERIKHEN